METVSWETFASLDIRAGRVLSVRPLPRARKAAWVLEIDFGPQIGVLSSSAQITALYDPGTLAGKMVVAVVNLPPKQIGSVLSRCLVTGFADEHGRVSLCVPDRDVPEGTQLS